MENLQLETRDCEFTTLSDIATILRNEMSNAFHELEVNISACSSLNRAPYNLAGVGLSGNPSVISVGDISRFIPTPQPNIATWDMQQILPLTSYDYFIIGAGYAARPHMPYNGHLIMNAKFQEPETITNASRIVFVDEITGQRRIETLTDPNNMKCSFMGNFFVSEGKAGNVIRVRAKGRKCNVDIITLMQDALFRHYYREERVPEEEPEEKPEEQRIVALGGVLKVKNGQVAQNVMPQQYPPQVLSFSDLAGWLQCHDMDLESDLIAVGTIVNKPLHLLFENQHHGYYLPIRDHNFHSFSDYGAGGQFIGDITKDITEYEGYFNLARKIHFVR